MKEVKVEKSLLDENMEYTVKFLWDSDAEVWVATSDDVPGLALESGSFDALVERVKVAVPELVELNSMQQCVSVFCMAEKHQPVYA